MLWICFSLQDIGSSHLVSQNTKRLQFNLSDNMTLFDVLNQIFSPKWLLFYWIFTFEIQLKGRWWNSIISDISSLWAQCQASVVRYLSFKDQRYTSLYISSLLPASSRKLFCSVLTTKTYLKNLLYLLFCTGSSFSPSTWLSPLLTD